MVLTNSKKGLVNKSKTSKGGKVSKVIGGSLVARLRRKKVPGPWGHTSKEKQFD